MMTLLRLCWEFFKTGLFAIGGGMATLPFLADIGESTGWYTYSDLMNMLAVSESTPGPIGINMATYVGFTAGGIPGAIVATLGEITPSIIVILIVAAMLKKFRDSKLVNSAFYGLRPASTALIAAALAQVCSIALMFHETAGPEMAPGSVVPKTELFYWPAIALAAVVFICLQIKPLKKLHPIVFIVLSAVAGIVFKL